MTFDEELYSYLSEHCNADGLPVMNTGEFKYCTEKYGKDVFRETLSVYIATERPPFPFKKISYADMVKNFHKLQTLDYTQFISPVDQLEREVFEKYDD